jgi:hypothetical protein
MLAAWLGLLLSGAALRAEDNAAIDARLSAAVKYLASDELEGRGVGTKGLNAAADYIAEQFRAIGLKTELFDGGPFQKFAMTTGSELGATNTLAITGPADKDGQPRKFELKLAESFTPLAIGGSGTFDLPLVFVGYGISGKEENYDDYAGLDVKGKAVVILRHEPQQANPHSAFNGTDPSEHAPFRRKVSNAVEHGAAAVILCDDQFEIDKQLTALRKRWQAAVDEIAAANERFKKIEKPTADDWQKHEATVEQLCQDIERYTDELEQARDPLLSFSGAGPGASEGRRLPVLACKRSTLDEVVQAALGKSLAELELEIDKGPTPHSQELAGWRVVGQTTINRHEVEVKNVVGVWEGEGPLADETIVIGAHYDHLGMGGEGSAAPGVTEIHNGADDNGSGTAVLIEVAREIVAQGRLPRRIVFIAFTGEERGLVGSARYVRNPLFPLESTVAMLNLDMVGRLSEDKLIVHGTGTAAEFDSLMDKFGQQYAFRVSKKPGGFGPSDHSSFYSAKVPVLFFFTGSHKDYHRPSDDFDKLNIEGMRRIAAMVVEIATVLAKTEARPQYKEVQDSGDLARSGGDRPYFGSIPDFAGEEPGYALTGVAKGGPADRGGLKGGDVIVQFGDSKIENLEDFDSALRKFQAGDKVPVKVKRGDKEVTLEVTLDPPR